ncbi:MAG: Ku protein [Candidatus Binatia bacterium]
MAKRQSKLHNRQSKIRKSARPIWKGSISFGLVNIPVALYSAEVPGGMDFDLLDRRDFSPVRYRRVSEKTGREVPWKEIVKGYQYEKGQYVALTDEDFQRANVEATQTIDITEFVEAGQISPIYYDKPYYLAPQKNGRRAYALLREVMSRTGKVGIAKVVIRTRQHLAAVFAEGPLLICDVLRFAHELRDPKQLDIAELYAKRLGISEREIKMAEQLVQAMSGEWNPEKYRDEYREDLLELIDKKVKTGRTKGVGPEEKRPSRAEGKVVDIMHLLKRSVEQAGKKEEPSRRRKAG